MKSLYNDPSIAWHFGKCITGIVFWWTVDWTLHRGLDSSSCAVQLKPSGSLSSFHNKRQEDIELWSLPHMQLWGPIYWYKGPKIRHCLTETICHVKGLLQFLIPDSYNSRLHMSFPHLMRVITVIDWLFEVTNLMGRGLTLHGGSPTWLVTLGN